jgi:SAM-dependent methyltransferase
MDKNYELKYHVVEEVHWWFQGRRDMIFNIIKNEDKNAFILDLGCSGGVLIQFLQEKGFQNVYGVDASEEAVNLCKQKGLQNVFLMSADDPQLSNDKFDIIIASDVLEHIKDDAKALTAWQRILKPGGKLIIFVPAFKFLWGLHDEVNHHQRRYSKTELVKRITQANLRIERNSYWNILLFLPIALMRVIQSKFFKTQTKENYDPYRVHPFINRFLTAVLRSENKLVQKLNFPFGLSLFAIVRK